MEYIMNGGETKDGKEDIPEAMDSLDTFVKLTKMVNASEKANSNKNGGNQNKNSKKKSNNKSNGEANHGSDNQQTSQPCKIHEGKHTWSECPNNTFSKNYKGNNGGKPINIDGAKTKKKTSFKEKSKNKAHFIREEEKSDEGNYYDPLENKDDHTVNSANFYFKSDDEETHGECMMTLQVGTQVHPITVISMPGKDKVTKATTCLIDQCCTGSGMITSAFAKIRGIESTPTTPREFSTANGTLTTDTEVRIKGGKLPDLFKRREFKLTLQIVPNTVSLNYRIVLGLKTMKQIDLDTSVRNETISWSDELSTPMVPQSFWSKERIAKLIESASHKKSDDPNSDGDPTISELFATEFKPNNDKNPDLTAVVAKNMYLNDDQHSQLLAVLQKNEHIFLGIRGTYAGPPVDIKLKPNAIPVWNRPYPIPLSQREAVKSEVERQCQV